MQSHEQTWKVGQLAKRTGLTVRTLHHYHAIGLLSPSGRMDSVHGSGHRLYTITDLARLHQILCLKQLGFGLEQIRECLTQADYDPRQVVRLHLEKVHRQAVELTELSIRLNGLCELLDRAEAVSPDSFLETIEVMVMMEKYYTPEQLDQLNARKEQVGEARIQEVQAEWQRLFAEVNVAMDAGTDPTNPEAQELARRWFGLVREFTGGDPGIFKSLNNMYQNEDTVSGMDVAAMRPMMEFIQKASAAADLSQSNAET